MFLVSESCLDPCHNLNQHNGAVNQTGLQQYLGSILLVDKIKYPSELGKKKVTVTFLLAVAMQIPINLFTTELQPV